MSLTAVEVQDVTALVARVLEEELGVPKTTEHTLQSQLLKVIRPAITAEGGVILKHSDYITSGIPDLSVTWKGMTSWWEIKHAEPRLKGTGLQLVTARQLALAGRCHYIVYETSRSGLLMATHIVTPLNIGSDGSFTPTQSSGGHDHGFVLTAIRQLHAA